MISYLLKNLLRVSSQLQHRPVQIYKVALDRTIQNEITRMGLILALAKHVYVEKEIVTQVIVAPSAIQKKRDVVCKLNGAVIVHL